MAKRKRALDNNNTSGNSHVDVEFDDEMRLIVGRDDSIEPEVFRGTNFVKRKAPTEDARAPTSPEPSSSAPQDASPVSVLLGTSPAGPSTSLPRWKRPKTKSVGEYVRETLLEIDERRAEREERRMRQKMDFLRELFAKNKE